MSVDNPNLEDASDVDDLLEDLVAQNARDKAQKEEHLDGWFTLLKKEIPGNWSKTVFGDGSGVVEIRRDEDNGLIVSCLDEDLWIAEHTRGIYRRLCGIVPSFPLLVALLKHTLSRPAPPLSSRFREIGTSEPLLDAHCGPSEPHDLLDEAAEDDVWDDEDVEDGAQDTWD